MDNVLVTGGCGFIGSQLVNLLHGTNISKLVVIDKIDYCSRVENIEVRDKLVLFKNDICDYDLVLSILNEYNIDTVFHLAAQTHVDRSFTNSLQFTKDNVVGTHNLLEACRAYGKINKFIHMSTDEVYGQSQHEDLVPNNESSIPNPTNPYSASKAAAEYLVKSYGYSYKFPYVIVRGNNVYGRGQYPDKLIPKFILSILRHKPLTVHGQGTATRSFVYVDDMVSGILLVGLRGQVGEIYNIGSRNEYSVLDITDKLCDIMGSEKHITYIQDRNFNDERYFINYNKVMSLGWEEKVSFSQGLQDTIKWYTDRQHEFE